MRCSTSTLAIALFASAGSAAQLTLNPDSGLMSVDGGSFANTVTFNGTMIRSGTLQSGVREFLVDGDLLVNDGDSITASSGTNNAIRLVVGNDAIIATGAMIDVSASGTTPRAGGGRGGSGGSGGNGGTAGSGGSGGSGGNGGSGGSGGFAANSFTPGFFLPSAGLRGQSGTNGQDGADGGRGLAGSQSNSGSSGLNAPGTGGSSASGGSQTSSGRSGGTGANAGGPGDGGAAGSSVVVNDGRTGDFGNLGSFGGSAGIEFITSQPGSSGQGGERSNSAADLLTGGGGGSGGGGGAGGAGGGGGGGGAGGGGGGGGGGGYGSSILVGSTPVGRDGGDGGRGGNGGDGGRGSSGGSGGRGGTGGSGGAGGGALEIEAYGLIMLDGTIRSRGSNGTSGSSGQSGGSTGSTGPREDGDDGTRGGFGEGSSGDGGDGGDGGPGGIAGFGSLGLRGANGGTGGGGAGGTVSLEAAFLMGEGMIDTSGGSGGRSGESGRQLTNATETTAMLSRSGAGINQSFAGPTANNPFASGPTPRLTGIVGGASPFGIAEMPASTIADLIDPAPPRSGASFTIALLEYPSAFGLGGNYPGFDVLAWLNTSAETLQSPRIGTGETPLDLLTAGFASDPRFGGSGPTVATALGADEAFVALIPEATELSIASEYAVAGSLDCSLTIELSELLPGNDALFITLPVACEPPCIADTTTSGTNPGDPGFGLPDGVVDIADLTFFVEQWIAADAAIADLTTTGTNPGDPGFGAPDGVVDVADLTFFVEQWLAGCP